ncbi:MAG: F0F1 ATP synthase subunit A, partial [Oscillospiraceae bacterium]|nr:F0F1 ATP synthase subunit A [Oscillospiraceae bacterium]
SGVTGLRPPTADWGTTFAFAFATLTIIQIAGIRSRGFDYIKDFFRPSFILFPLNLLGELARPISLSFRLFGNMLAGLIILTMFYSLTPLLLRLVLPIALHVYFDVFSGVLQTYIFCAISLSFIGATSPSTEG